MQRLLLENDWYDPVRPNSVMDTDYEALILGRSAVLFPNFTPVPLHYRVTNSQGHASPHIALIEKTYRSWWLVLLETGSAPEPHYVRQQAEVLRAADYGPDFLEVLTGRGAEIDPELVSLLIKNKQPGVFLILCHPPAPDVDDPAVRIGIAEIFKSTTGAHILRINGRHPPASEERLGTCTRNRHVLPNLLRLRLDPGVEAKIPGRCEIEIDGTVSTWTARPQPSEIFLVPDGSTGLPVDQDIFVMIRGAAGRFRLLTNRT